jgi:outer membrane receptor protein involved in Fe transport
MIRPLSTFTLLMASTLFYAPAILAQTGDGAVQTSAPSAPVTTAQAEAPEEEVEISVPGGSSGDDEDIVVRGRFIPDIIRSTPQVVSVLSTADIARTGEGDIAGALTRVTGLTVVGNGFVFVRGLGDRYSSALLNGSPLPSPDPLRRTVPLDIFPTSIIASSLVQKSYSVNYPGEFGGGVINLTTRAVPLESFISLSASIGVDTVATGKQGLGYYGSRGDDIGFDAGERDVPQVIQEGGLTRNFLFSNEIVGFSGARTSLLQRFQLPANYNVEFSGGHIIDVGSDAQLGLVGSAQLSNSWRNRDAIQQETIDPAGALRSDFRTRLTDNRVVFNALLGAGLEFSTHKIRFTNVYINDAVKQGRLGAATVYLNSSGQPILQQNTNYFRRQLIDTQGVGEFRFGDLSLDLRGTYANSKRLAPYERAFSYIRNASGVFQNDLNGQAQFATIAFSRLNEDLYSGAADLGYKLNTERPITLTAGYYYSDQQRESTRFDFRYRSFLGGGINQSFAVLRPDLLLSEASIRQSCTNPTTVVAEQGCIRLFNTSGVAGAAFYDAGLRIHAGYGQVEAELADGLRVIAGVRYEDAVQRVNTNSPSFGGTRLANDYWLPAATVTWNFVENMQLRLNASRTIARPQFRELAPQIYRDFEFDRFFIGNPRLTDSELDNFEGRYEWYPSRDDRVAVAGFYKRIKRPTEQVAFFPGEDATLTTGFSYAPRATLYGVEAEIQKYVPLDMISDALADRRLVLIANYTYTKSELNVSDALVPSPTQNAGSEATLVPASRLFRDGAPLTGQSDHIANVQIGIDSPDRVSQATLLINYASDRVTNRGPSLLPDIIERPGVRLDFVAREEVELFGGNFQIKFEARNLTGTPFREFQQFPDRRVFVNRWDVGRSFTLGISATY